VQPASSRASASTDVRVLCHCRAGGRHGPGCWVVERVLGRA
jgi:hypothetical protein